MANVRDIKRKPIKITLSDGVERELKFTLNALTELEEKYGSVDEAFKALEANKISAVRFVLWAGLSWQDDALTEKQVGNLIDVQNMQDIMNNLGSAFEADMPKEEETKVVDNNPN